MREIKFRAWDKKYSVMWQGIELTKLLHYLIFQKMPNADAYRALKDHYGEIEWLQYTGIKDKNGKEIFGGDLLCMSGDTTAYYEVFYHDGEACFSCARSHYNSSRCGGYIPSLDNNKLEVIGNIYENPELLK